MFINKTKLMKMFNHMRAELNVFIMISTFQYRCETQFNPIFKRAFILCERLSIEHLRLK